MRKVRHGERYRHYDGDVYRIIAVATHAISQKSYVIYQSERNGRTLTMPSRLFRSSVTVDGRKVPQFELIR